MEGDTPLIDKPFGDLGCGLLFIAHFCSDHLRHQFSRVQRIPHLGLWCLTLAYCRKARHVLIFC